MALRLETTSAAAAVLYEQSQTVGAGVVTSSAIGLSEKPTQRRVDRAPLRQPDQAGFLWKTR